MIYNFFFRHYIFAYIFFFFFDLFNEHTLLLIEHSICLSVLSVNESSHAVYVKFQTCVLHYVTL